MTLPRHANAMGVVNKIFVGEVRSRSHINTSDKIPKSTNIQITIKTIRKNFVFRVCTA